MQEHAIHCRKAQSFWLTIFLICNLLAVQWASADPWSGRRLYAGDAYVNGDFSASKFFGEVSSATVADASNQIPQDDLEYILSELWYKTGIAYNQRYHWDGGATNLNAVLGRQSLGLGTAALRNAEDTLTNGENLPDGAAIINYINGRGFITDPNDSVQPSELDGTFSTVGLLKRLGAGSYTTVPDNSANWDQAYGWGNHATQGYLKTYNPNDSVDASELEVLFGPLGSGLMIHSASGVFIVTPDNHANWDTAYSWGNHATQGYLKSYNPNDSVSGAELDSELFDANGILIKSASGTFSTTPDNHANWDTAYGWGNHANAGYLKPPQQNDSVDARELEVLFGPLGVGLMIHSASGVFTTTPDNHVNWDTAYTERRQWNGGPTNLDAPTGRNSLGLGSAALSLATDFAGAAHNHGTGTAGYIAKWQTNELLERSVISESANLLNLATSAVLQGFNYYHKNVRTEWIQYDGAYRAYLKFPASTGLSGSLRLTITIPYITYGTSVPGGTLIYEYGFMGNSSGTAYVNKRECKSTIGNTADYVVAGDIVWHTTDSCWAIPIYNLQKRNYPLVSIDYYSWYALDSTFTITCSSWETYSMVPSRDYSWINDRLAVGKSGGAAFTLDVNGTARIIGSALATTPSHVAVQGGSDNVFKWQTWGTFVNNLAASGGVGGGNIGGTGSAGYVAKWIAGATIANSIIQDDGTNIAIGKTPTAGIKLDVDGVIRGSLLQGPGSTGAVGSITVKGSKGGYSGINFTNLADGNMGSFLATTQYSGYMSSDDLTWDWRWTDDTLTEGKVPAARIPDLATFIDDEVDRLLVANNAISLSYTGAGNTLSISARYDNSTIKTNIDNQLYVNPGEIPFSGLKGVSVGGVTDNQILKYIAGSWIAAATAADDDSLKTVDWDNFVDRTNHHIDINAKELGGVYVLDGYSTNDMIIRADGKLRFFDDSPVGTPYGGSFGGEYYNGNYQGQWWNIDGDKKYEWRLGAANVMILSATDLNLQNRNISDVNDVVANGAVYAKNRHYAWNGSSWEGGVSSGGDYKVVTNLRWNGTTLQHKYRTHKVVKGIVVALVAESDWENVP